MHVCACVCVCVGGSGEVDDGFACDCVLLWVVHTRIYGHFDACLRVLVKVQAQFNAWAEETGLSYLHLSRICAMSIGENHTPEEIVERTRSDY